jgi:regulator of RNase E activity RraA
MGLGFRIVSSIQRAPADLVARFAEADSADLSDVLRHSTTMVGITPLWRPAPRAVGPAVTVSVPLGGVSVLRAGMDACRPGDVLVVAARGAREFAMFGGFIAQAMANRGLAGLVVDGAVRDVEEIERAGLATFARGQATPAGPSETPGEINVPVACAGAVVSPGDIVVADGNGVVVVSPDIADAVLAGLDGLHQRHLSWHDDVAAGRVPALGTLYQRLAELGCDVGERAGAEEAAR